MPATPVLAITDGTTRISLHNDAGLYLRNWAPGRPADKKTRREPVYGGGGQVVINDQGNVVDTFEVGIRGYCQDHIIADLQEVDRLLEQAVNYWASDWTTTPVWLEAKGPDETNTRYACIKDYAIDGMSNPYAQPFFTNLGAGAMNALTIAIEHDIWQSAAPGTATALQVSATDERDRGRYSPLESADDADVDVSSTTIWTAGTAATFGRTAGASRRHTAMRFRSLVIPRGATIVDAWIEGVAESSLAANNCNVIISGENSATPAAYTTYANLVGRGLTTANVAWNAIPAWTVGLRYRTPSIVTIVQELVNLAAWTGSGSLAFQLRDNGSTNNALRTWASWDNATYQEPYLFVLWKVAGVYGTTIGYAAGTGDNGMVANYHNRAQLTHILVYDASGPSYTSVLGTALPYNLFPAALGNGDITYFGIESSAADAGPFCNLVFSPSTRLTYTAPAHMHWQYWNGAWVDLAEFDESSGGAPNTPFDTLVAISATQSAVSWSPPSDWVTTAVSGITGWWVRVYVDITAGAIAGTVSQSTRQPYTVNWNSVRVDADQTGGDIPMLSRLRIHQRSDYDTAASASTGNIGRVVVGLRSEDRGVTFQSFVPLVDRQNPSAHTITYPGAGVAAATDALSIYYQSSFYSVAAASTMQDEIEINFGSDSPYYVGAYHMFVRYRRPAGSDNELGMRLRMGTTWTVGQYSDTVLLKANNHIEVADFGRINLFPWTYGIAASSAYRIYLNIQMANYAAAAKTCYVYDLVLVPCDEWYAAFNLDALGDSLRDELYLDADSASYPKARGTAVLREGDWRGSAANSVQFPWARYAAGPNILQANESQRLHFFFRDYHSYLPPTLPQLADWLLACSVRVSGVERYKSMRGID